MNHVNPCLQGLRIWRRILLSLLTVWTVCLAAPAMAQTMAEGDAAFDKRDYATALRIYLSDPQSGNRPRAWSRLGYMYKFGHGTSRDEREALKWFRKAAEQDQPYAQNQLGLAYRNGEGVAVNPAEAHKWFELAARKGYAGAQNSLGVMYRDGVFVNRDPAEAVRLFKLAAAQGLIWSQNNLGMMYRDGVGVPRDLSEAAVWFRQAVANPLDDDDTRRVRPLAQRNLAGLDGSSPAVASRTDGASSGEGDAAFARRDYAAAARLYASEDPAPDKGRAWMRLGYLHLNGTGVTRDEKEALKWFRKAAGQNNASAQNALGNAYRRGEGVERDFAEALKWYRLAAQQSNGYAQNSLGVMYQSGEGVARDATQALSYFRQSAALNNVWGLLNLGHMYREGGVVPQDPAEAMRLYRQVVASPQDDDDARRAKPQARQQLARLEQGGAPAPERSAAAAVPAVAAAPAAAAPATTAASSQAEQLRKENEELRRRQQETEAQVAELIRRAQAAPVAPAAAPAKALNAHALVLGNSAYAGSARLPNPANDAKAVAAKLRSMGFQVTEVLDTSRVRLASALTAFSRTAARADLSLLFYAGHGVQVNGTNYILPVDMDMGDVESVVLQGISLNSVVEQYLPGETKLVLLDACRDNPLARSSSRGVSRGLAPINVSKGTLIAYSTKDGATAEDGSSKNSPFTEALLEHLGDPDDISVVLRKVREQVLRKTNNRQEPWDYGSLTGGALVLSRVRGSP